MRHRVALAEGVGLGSSGFGHRREGYCEAVSVPPSTQESWQLRCCGEVGQTPASVQGHSTRHLCRPVGRTQASLQSGGERVWDLTDTEMWTASQSGSRSSRCCWGDGRRRACRGHGHPRFVHPACRQKSEASCGSCACPAPRHRAGVRCVTTPHVCTQGSNWGNTHTHRKGRVGFTEVGSKQGRVSNYFPITGTGLLMFVSHPPPKGSGQFTRT